MIEDFLEINNTRHPVEIHIEKRPSSRASIGKKAVYIRIPSHFPISIRETHIRRFKKWAYEKISEGGNPFAPMQRREYENGERIIIAGSPFTLVLRSPRRSHAHEKASTATRMKAKSAARESGRIVGNEIRISLVVSEDKKHLQERISRLIAKSVGRHMLPAFEARIEELNRIHFRFQYNRIRLKNMSSRWGSCSSKGNLNFAVRLCLAPPDVIDYVIVHELAHIRHRNHSRNFWGLVGKVMPSWKERRAWLRTNQDACIF